MRKIKILSILPLATFAMLSFSSNTELPIDEAALLSPCTDYCSGYADAKEEDGKVQGLEEWNAEYEACKDRRCPDEY